MSPARVRPDGYPDIVRTTFVMRRCRTNSLYGERICPIVVAYYFGNRSHPLRDRNDGSIAMKANDKIDPRELRRKMGVNQQQFWSRLGDRKSVV